MDNNESLICNAIAKHVRVNVDTKSVEFYDAYGVKLVLTDLDNATFDAFKAKYQNF